MYLWGEGETRTSVMHSNSQYNSEILTGQHLPSLYGDHFSGYHQFGDPLVNPPAGAWEEALREDEWAVYGHSFTDLSSGAGQTAGYIPPGVPGGVSFPTLTHNSPAEVDTPQLLEGRRCNDWMKNSVHPSVPGGKTRTKDKYRVVYTDYQRLELEKEFQYSLYITIRRKAELSLDLGLTERQVKIWFQNRRAKERKLTRRKLQLSQQAPTATPAQPNNTSPSSDNALSHTVLMAVKEEF